MKNQTSPSSERLLLIVGGAFNHVLDDLRPRIPRSFKDLVRLGGFAFELAYSEANRHLLASIASIAVQSEIIIPPYLGIRDLEGTYETVEKEMLERISRYPKETKITGVGYSLGGDLMARFISKHPDQIGPSVSIAGPHLGSVIPWWGPKHFKDFSDQTADIRHDNGVEAAPLTYVGADLDLLITPASSMPTPLMMSHDTSTEIPGFVHHLRITRHPAALEACADALELSAA